MVNIFRTRLDSGTKASPKYFHIGDRKENIIHCQMRNEASNLANSWNIQLFSVLAVVYANDGWKKLQFAYLYYFPVYYFVQVHSICLSMLFKPHSLIDYECTWLRLFRKRISYTKSKKCLKIRNFFHPSFAYTTARTENNCIFQLFATMRHEKKVCFRWKCTLVRTQKVQSFS
jgi:hypothetical protein